MDELIGLQFHAEARVERGTATHCACGGEFEQVPDGWRCLSCGREYA